MFSIIRTIVVLLVLVIGVFLVSHFAGPTKNQVLTMLGQPVEDVKGASTIRAEQLTNQFSKDLGKQIDTAKQNVLEIKIADMFHFLSRFQKIPQDAENLQEYVHDVATKEQKK